jgi:hypothetical protein
MAHTRHRNKRKPRRDPRRQRLASTGWRAWEVAALHEAAHAVAAEYAGVPVERVSLSVEPSGDTACIVGGVTRFADLAWNEADTPAVMRALTLVAVAGHAMEQVIGVDDSEYHQPGARTVWGASRATDLSAAHGHRNELARAQGAEWTDADRDALVATAIWRATAFVREHFAEIEAVANLLLRRVRAVLLASAAPSATHWRVSLEWDELRALLGHPSESHAPDLHRAAAG